MSEGLRIETLNDLFSALFKPGEGGEGEAPVVRQPRRPLREALFALFFPDALVEQYADKSKSNLTWFFNSDPRNKSVRRTLAGMLRANSQAVVDETHRKCHQALWPRPGHAVFDAARLKDALAGARLPAALDGRFHITRPGDDGAISRLELFFGVDEAAALARILLTLAVAGDVPADVIGEIWRDGPGGACDFLAEDTTVAGSIRHARMLDLQGRHDRAFQAFERVASQLDRPAQTMDESAMYCRMGEMLFTGEGAPRDERAALRYDELGLLDGNPRSYHQYGRHATGTPARQAMERAAQLGYAPAIRELGDAWFNGSARLAALRNLESARRCYQLGLGVPGADGAYCAYMLGQIYEAQGERGAAVNAYRVAQEGGSAEAAERLAGLDWMLDAPSGQASPEPKRVSAGGTCYCLANGRTGANRVFLDGLRGKWDVTVCGEGGAAQASLEKALRELAQGVFWGGAPQFPELAVALLSDDGRANLRDAVAVLGELQRLAKQLGERAWDLVDAVDVYVMAEHDYGALLLDAAFAGMGELYFRVRLCDAALDAADALFAAAPLFLPRLRAASDTVTALKIAGCGDAAMAALRRALALPMPEGMLTVDVYGEGAEAMGRRFRRLCPGAVSSPELMGALPRFHEANLEEELPEGMLDGNYYIVATGDDAVSLRLAVALRGALMRLDPGAERAPFIAVHTPGAVESWLAASLPAGTEAVKGGGWWSQYELFPFGSEAMYAPDALRGDSLEKRARQAHMLFLGLPNTRDARHAAMGSYYRRQFSRDTARATAASLVYRLHLAGIDLPGWRLYGVAGEEARLGADYTRWLKAGENLQAAARDEHLRRNRALICMGWQGASAETVAACVRRGNPGHRLYPARLDPFICPFEALEGGELLAAVRDAVRARFPERSVADPRRDEEASVRDTETLLGEG